MQVTGPLHPIASYVYYNNSILLTIPSWLFFHGSFLLFMFPDCLCCAVVFAPWGLVVTFWERADLLALVRVVFSFIDWALTPFRQAVTLFIWSPIIGIK